MSGPWLRGESWAEALEGAENGARHLRAAFESAEWPWGPAPERIEVTYERYDPNASPSGTSTPTQPA